MSRVPGTQLREVKIGKSTTIQYIPQQITNLARELCDPAHQPLLAKLKETRNSNYLENIFVKSDPYMLVEQIKDLATHFGIILDGAYSETDLLGLCEILTGKLYESRTSLAKSGRTS